MNAAALHSMPTTFCAEQTMKKSAKKKSDECEKASDEVTSNK
jgi:hypothetical protein